MTPLSRAIWLLARLGAEAEKNEEVAPLLGGPAATSVDQEQISAAALSVPTHDFIVHQDTGSVNSSGETTDGAV